MLKLPAAILPFYLFFLLQFSLSAQTTIDFDDASKWVAGSGGLGTYQVNHSYTDGVFSSTGGQAMRNATTNQDGFPGANGTYSWRLRDVTSANPDARDLRFTIASGGVGNFSVAVRRWDGAPNPAFRIEYSLDGGSVWTLVADINNTTLNNSSDWTTFNGTINSTNTDIIIRFFADDYTTNPLGSERIMIDDFSWFPFAGPLTGSAATPSTILCPGIDDDFLAFPVGGTLPYSFEWDFGDGTIDSASGNSAQYAYAAGGTYNGSVTITDALGDTVIVPFTVVVASGPVAHLSLDNVICTNIIDAISSSTGNNLSFYYMISNNISLLSFDPVTGDATFGGTGSAYSITLVAIDEDGCMDSMTQTGTLILPEDATFSLNKNSVCQGDSVVLVANNTLGEWSGTGVTDNGDGTGIFSGSALNAGYYDITYSITGICPAAHTETMEVMQVPTADFTFSGSHEVVFMDASNNAVFPSAYNWDFGDGTTYSGFIDPTHEYTEEGIYTVCLEVVNGNGCSDVICKEVVVEIIGLNSLSATKTFEIYPNPNFGRFILFSAQNAAFSITNLFGKEVYKGRIFGREEIDLSPFGAGTYFVTIQNSQETVSQKIVIK